MTGALKMTDKPLSQRFRQFLPIVIDVETAGINAQTDALLELAAITVSLNASGQFITDELFHAHILPFEGARLDPEALAFNKIDPYHPFREALEEKEALTQLFEFTELALKKSNCQRAVLVGHNAWFDLLFLNNAIKRTGLISPFHRFTSFDTATLSAVHYGQTVLAKACDAAGIEFNTNDAHSAIYDTEKTAALFCKILNTWHNTEKA